MIHCFVFIDLTISFEEEELSDDLFARLKEITLAARGKEMYF